jgi:hypothetical protein
MTNLLVLYMHAPGLADDLTNCGTADFEAGLSLRTPSLEHGERRAATSVADSTSIRREGATR